MKSILIADDNPHAQRMGSQILGQAGHKVFTLSNGDQVHSFVAEHHPDVAILDLRMPGVSGVELCRRIKSDRALSSTKVLLLAGPLDHINAAEVENAGSDGVVQKPLDAHTLTTMIEGLFDDAGQAADTPNQLPERPGSLVDPPPPPSPVRAFTGNGATPAPGRKGTAGGAGSELKGATGSAASADESPLHATEAQSQPLHDNAASENRAAPPMAPRAASPPNLEIASDDVMAEISDVVLGAMAPAPPRSRPRENGHSAVASKSNGRNGHAGKSLDPFAALVESALGKDDHDAEFEARVAQIVDEAVQVAMHTIRERITNEVIASYRRIAV